MYSYPFSIVCVEHLSNLDECTIRHHVTDPVVWFTVSLVIQDNHASHTYQQDHHGKNCLQKNIPDEIAWKKF